MNAINLKIEADIEIPTSVALVDLLPWQKMKVGYSFPVTSDELGENPVERLRAAISYRQKAAHEKYSVRKMPDGTYRCWRVA